MHYTLINCCEFGYGNDANAWRKSTKEAEKEKKLQFRKKNSLCVQIFKSRYKNLCS